MEITNYRQAIDRVAQTSLREMIGSSMLAALLSDRKAADEQLRNEIGEKTAKWGISVTSAEIRDVAIPVALQDAMSRQAQAEREKQARAFLVRPKPRSLENSSKHPGFTPTIPERSNFGR